MIRLAGRGCSALFWAAVWLVVLLYPITYFGGTGALLAYLVLAVVIVTALAVRTRHTPPS
jgi:hypothetical protein